MGLRGNLNNRARARHYALSRRSSIGWPVTFIAYAC
jgi:hypothetical protein